MENDLKAVLSNRIYMPYTRELLQKIAEYLTYKIPPMRRGAKAEIIKVYNRINDNILSIPIGRQDLIPSNYKIIDKRVDDIYPDFPDMLPNIKLRDTQQIIYEKCDDNWIINAKPGYGKTFTALAIASKLKRKTLIIVHTVKLRKQWENEIESVLGIKPGVIGSGKYNTDSLIIVANTQTLVKHVDKLKYEFGTLITDECLDYETLIETEEFGKKKLGVIVNNKLKCSVKSWNGDNWEWKKVLNYYKNPQDWFIHFKFSDTSSLRCTENHKIYCYRNGKIEQDIAGNILEGEKVVTTKTCRSPNLLFGSVSLLLGLILGDGAISKSTNSIRVKIVQGQAQKGYLEYKEQLMSNIMSDAKMIKGKSGYKKENNIYSISSLSFTDELLLHDKIYKNNKSKTHLPKSLSKLLDKEAWSLLYQDDGSISKKTINFHLYFDEEGTNNLIKSLNNIFDVTAKVSEVTKNNKILRVIRLSVSDSYKFLFSIKDLIHPDLYYKFGEHDIVPNFKGITNRQLAFRKFSAVEVVDIEFAKPTGGFRYNIEVQDNHNYTAGNKLVSNCHHTPSTTFRKILDKIAARYKIGLSGTLRRKDGKHVLITDYISNNVYIPPKENVMDPTIIAIKTSIVIPGNSMMPWANRVNDLYKQENYRRLLQETAEAQVERGHTVLVVSDRVDFLHEMAERTPMSVCVTSKVDNQEEIENQIKEGSASILWGSINIYKEGVSINEISSVIIGCPINNGPVIVQLVGRCIRKKKDKLPPEIIDPIFAGYTGENQFRTRLNAYRKEMYKVVYID